MLVNTKQTGTCSALQDVQHLRSADLATELLRSPRAPHHPPNQSSMHHLCSAEKAGEKNLSVQPAAG